MGRAFSKEVLGLVLALGCAGPALAANPLPADPQTADSLAASLNAAACQPFASFSVPLVCQWQGQIRVTPAGDHYQAEVPELVARIGNGRRVNLGNVRLDLWLGAGGTLDFAIALPSTFTLFDSADKPDMNVTLGFQQVEGRWDSTAHSVTRLNAGARDLRLTSRSTPHIVSIGTVSITQSLAESQPGHWGGPAGLAFEKLSLRTPDGAEMLALDSFALEGRVGGLDLPLAIARHAQSQATAEASLPAPAPAPAAMAGRPAAAAPAPVKKNPWKAARRYLSRLHDLFDSVSIGLHLKGLTLKVPLINTTVALGRFDYQTSLSGLEQGASSMAVTYEHGPLIVAPPPTLQEFMPKAARLALKASGLPNASLWQALEHALPPDDSKGEHVFKTFLTDADEALTKAGSGLVIDTLSIDTPATSANLTGKAQYDATAAMGMVAQYDMIIRGFDTALKALQPAPGSNDLSDSAKNILSALTMLQVMGLPAKDSAGRDARTYKVDIAKTGGVMLNGADITILVQGLKERLGRHAQAAPKP